MDELGNGRFPFSTGAFEEQHTAEAYIGFTLGRLRVATATEKTVGFNLILNLKIRLLVYGKKKKKPGRNQD